MARHKKMQAAEDESPALDISSLIDCCFLLLCYFLTATTLVKEHKLDMSMPGNTPGPQDVPIDPANIRIDPSGVIWYGAGNAQEAIEKDPNNRNLETLFKRLESVRTIAEGTGQQPVVVLHVMNNAKHQRVIDVIDAISRAKITTVALADVKEDE